MGRRIHDYYDPICVLTRPAAEALAEAQQALRPQGYTLKVYDCYRPQTAVDDFVGWARRLHDDRMKAEFYPRWTSRACSRMATSPSAPATAVAPRSISRS